jgi:hypothetical protein
MLKSRLAAARGNGIYADQDRTAVKFRFNVKTGAASGKLPGQNLNGQVQCPSSASTKGSNGSDLGWRRGSPAIFRKGPATRLRPWSAA